MVLTPLADHLSDYGIRSIAEIFDGDGTDPLSCGNPTIACAAGSDGNLDGRIDAADLIGPVGAPRNP